MKTDVFLLGFVTILVCGCLEKTQVIAPQAQMQFKLNDTLLVAIADTLHYNADSIWFSFDALISDSRCPRNVDCIWEGNARAQFTLSRSDRAHAFMLDTHQAFNPDTVIADLQIALLDVLPYPHTDSLYTESDFRALVVIRVNSD